MKHINHTQKGFTIVELLIVVVVIAILAAITIVAYNGIQNRAKSSSLQATFAQTARVLEASKVASGLEQYPASLAAASITQSPEYSYTYQTQNTTAGTATGYCLTLTKGGVNTFITSASPTPTPGTCQGLVGWWTLNDTTEARDSSGYNRHGQQVGATSTVGYNNKDNGGYEFTATNSRITVPSVDLLNVHNSGEVSYSIWFVYSGSGSGTILARGTPSGSGPLGLTSCQYEPAIGITSVNMSGCSSSGNITGVSPVTGWNHLALTLSISGDRARVYLNGVEVGSKTITAIKSASSAAGYILNAQPAANFLVIGSTYNDGANSYSNSGQRIDDVRVFNRALSAAEVTELYQAGAQ